MVSESKIFVNAAEKAYAGTHRVSDKIDREKLPENWPNRLREVREASGVTMMKFCKDTGLSESRVSRTEQNKNSASLDLLAVYALYFKRPLSDFIADNYAFCDYAPQTVLSKDESELIANFRRLSPSDQGQIANFVSLLSTLAPASAAMRTLLAASAEERQVYLDLLDRAFATIDLAKRRS